MKERAVSSLLVPRLSERTDNSTFLSVGVHTCVMATKSVTIKESAYEILKSRKENNESFSDVIERIARRRPLTDLNDVVSKSEGENIAEEVEKVREEMEEELENRSKRISDAVE